MERSPSRDQIPSQRRPRPWRRLRNARGPIIVALWAFAPPMVVQSPDGAGLSLSFGASTGQVEMVSRSCTGELLDSTPLGVQSATVMAEYQPANAPFRIAAYAGNTWLSSSGPQTASYGAGGTFGAMMLAWEHRRVGLGLGLATTEYGERLPSIHLRLGDRAGGYLQGDFLAPSPMPTATGLVRAGFGFQRQRVRGLVGLSMGRLAHEEGDDNGGPFAEVRLGLADRWDLLVAGSYWESEEHSDWGAGIGLRYHFGG